MGRDATKAAGNPWYQARKKAAEYDDRLCSRESAAEQLGMSVSSLADAELGNTKFMPVDTGELSVRINGNESAALRFFPSEEAIIDGLRKNGVEAAYGDFADTYPHTHGSETDALLTISGDS